MANSVQDSPRQLAFAQELAQSQRAQEMENEIQCIYTILAQLSEQVKVYTEQPGLQKSEKSTSEYLSTSGDSTQKTEDQNSSAYGTCLQTITTSATQKPSHMTIGGQVVWLNEDYLENN